VSLSKFFSRLRKDESAPDADGGQDPVHPTKALGRLVTGLSARPHPVVLDLGPVVGANVSFFGEQLGCKIIVEDVVTDLEAHVGAGTTEQLPAFFETRFPESPESIDGILCWDVFDHLDSAAARSLARQLGRLLRPGGVLMAMFSTTQAQPGAPPEHTRYVVLDQGRLQYRPYAASRPRQRPLPNREIQLLFEPLQVGEQFLLKSNMREVLFRKPPAAGGMSVPPGS
jgi:hypothetical protein